MDSRPHFYVLIGASLIVGLVIGLFSTGFRLVWLEANEVLWSTTFIPYQRLVVSLTAGLIIGTIITVSFYPGTLSTLIHTFHTDGEVSPRENVPIIPSGLIGLVSGQSAGPEGVMSVVGGSVGSVVSERFPANLPKPIMTLAGMGAGFGAILGAPIGGGLLWLELPHEHGIEYYEAIIPTMVASFAGYLTIAFTAGLEIFPAWTASAIAPVSTVHLFAAVVIGLACVPFSYLYTVIFKAIRVPFDAVDPPHLVRTLIGGLGIGTLGTLIPLTYFYGGKHINEILTGSFTVKALLVILIGKMVAASLTIHGNWQGGLIIPHMFMGAIVGRLSTLVVPVLPPEVGMLAGMAGFNSAVTGTPLSSALIAISLTDGASIVPVFLGSLTAFTASPLIEFIETTASRIDDLHRYGRA